MKRRLWFFADGEDIQKGDYVFTDGEGDTAEGPDKAEFYQLVLRPATRQDIVETLQQMDEDKRKEL